MIVYDTIWTILGVMCVSNAMKYSSFKWCKCGKELVPWGKWCVRWDVFYHWEICLKGLLFFSVMSLCKLMSLEDFCMLFMVLAFFTMDAFSLVWKIKHQTVSFFTTTIRCVLYLCKCSHDNKKWQWIFKLFPNLPFCSYLLQKGTLFIIWNREWSETKSAVLQNNKKIWVN